MRLRLAAVTAAALLAGCAGGDSSTPAGHTKAKAVVLHTNQSCGDDRAAKPPTITLACATGGLRIEQLEWTSWGGNTAKASGLFRIQGCDPSCAEDNRTYTYAAEVTAHQPVACADGARQYTFIEYTVTDERSDANRPQDGTLGFDCPK